PAIPSQRPVLRNLITHFMHWFTVLSADGIQNEFPGRAAIVTNTGKNRQKREKTLHKKIIYCYIVNYYC
ncbi:MAG: hypothetical protein ABW168_06445, partial [Sedimenticola sp.]